VTERSPVIITGGGSGLGRALALALARQGRPLSLAGRRRDRLAETQAACLAQGAEACHIVVADVADPQAAARVVDETLDRFGAIGALVNNAAVARFSRLEAARSEDWELMLRTNVLAPAQLTAFAIPALRQAGGCVVNIGSVGGVLSLPGRAVYGASKSALAHLTRSLARELAPDIRVNAIIPGAIDTEMYQALDLEEGAIRELRAEMARTTPLGRMGDVGDVVPWIEMLLSDAGRWMTGSLIVVDGGRSC
jgi:NAD(P)-dependent dehydrogenase (short-subunit alcohol dehydrogenase family)